MTLKILLFSLISFSVYAKTIKVVVMDTGYFVKESTFKECVGLERNFTKDDSMEDFVPHGQNIVGIITKDLDKIDYCVINIKIMTKKPFETNKYEQALFYAILLKPDIINMSFEGSMYSETESILIKLGLDSGIRFIAAAGNDHVKLTDKNCKIYPACLDPRIETVGSLSNKDKKSRFSNYGNRVKYWEHAEKIHAGGFTMSGTSQAAALRTNRIIKELAK